MWRASIRATSRRSPRRRGSARRCSGWCGSCAAPAMTCPSSRPLLDGATDAPEKAASLAEILAEFEARRTGFYGPDDALLAAEPERARRARAAGVGDARPAAGARAAAHRRRRADAGRRLPRRRAGGGRRAAGASCARACSQAGATLSDRAEPGRSGDSALDRVRRLAVHAAGRPGDRRPTGRCGWCRRPTRRARCARRRARALQWAREGVPFWDMAVAYRHGEAYLPLAEAVFVEAGIPVYLHEGSPLAERPLGRQTLGAAGRCSTSELSRQSVMDFLTDARFPEALHDEYGGISGRALGLALARGRDRQGRRAVAQAAGRDRGRCRASEDDPPEWVRQRAEDAGTTRRGSSPTSTGGCASGRHGRRGRCTSTTCRRCSSATSTAPTRSIVALRGLERFTALEARGRLRLVPRRGQAGDRDAALRGRDRQPAGGVRRAAA